MKTNLLKEEIKELLKRQIINVLNKKNLNYINYNPSFLFKTIKEYLYEIKLDEKDYNLITNELIEELLSNIYYLQIDQTANIINILSNKIKNSKLEYTNDSDPAIYIHLHNNHSYLINYDEIEKRWYLALINTDSLNLVKEIYNDNYTNFISYLNKFF